MATPHWRGTGYGVAKTEFGTALSLGGIVAAAPLIAACGGGEPSYQDWAATDGAAGRINLDDVQQAFKNSQSATDFERRVNEIYEGDGLVLIRARQDGETLTLEGWEDLDSDNTIDDTRDDLLFTIVQNTGGDYEMRGYHSNGYYHSYWGPGDFLSPTCLSRPSLPGSVATTTRRRPHEGRRYATSAPPTATPRPTTARSTATPAINNEAGVLRWLALSAVPQQRKLQPQQLPVHPENQRGLQDQQHCNPHQFRPLVLAQFRRLRRGRCYAGAAKVLGIGGPTRMPDEGPFTLHACLAGMAPDDLIRLEMPPECRNLSVSNCWIEPSQNPLKNGGKSRRSSTPAPAITGPTPTFPDIYNCLPGRLRGMAATGVAPCGPPLRMEPTLTLSARSRV